MLTRLSFDNYRAFEKLDLPLTKINLFLGPNNSGKSSILSSISLLSQTINSDDPVIPLLLTGKFEDLGTYQDTVHNNDPSLNITLGLELSADKIKDKIKKIIGSSIFGISVTFHYRKQRHETVVNSLRIYNRPNRLILRTHIAEKGSNQLIEKVGKRFGNITLGSKSSGSIELEHFFPTYNAPLRQMVNIADRPSYPSGDLETVLWRLYRTFTEHLNSIEFIGPFRRGPERVYTYSGETPSSVGVHGEKSIEIIVADHFRRMSKKLNITDNISKWLQKSQIADALNVVPLTDRHFEIRLSHYNTSESENLADVGYGCSQILPILVSGFSIKPNSTLIIEQPEIHLHPKAQAEVGTFLYEVSKRNVQLLIETHSEHLLLRLQSHVASGDLKPNDISVFYVYSDPITKEKKCKSIPLGRNGFYIQDWPQGFFPERLDEAKNIAKFAARYDLRNSD